MAIRLRRQHPAVFMSKPSSDCLEIHARFDRVRAKEVSQRMMTKPWQARSLTGGPERLPNILKSKNVIIFRDVAALCSHRFKQSSQRRKKRNGSIFVIFRSRFAARNEKGDQFT